MFRPYKGDDVKTEGPDRHVKVRGLWMRAFHPASGEEVFYLGLSPQVCALGWSDGRGPGVPWWTGYTEEERAALLSTIDGKVAWTATWGENTSRGEASTLPEARTIARKAYGPAADGSRVLLYVDDVLVFSETLDLTVRQSPWRNNGIGYP